MYSFKTSVRSAKDHVKKKPFTATKGKMEENCWDFSKL